MEGFPLWFLDCFILEPWNGMVSRQILSISLWHQKMSLFTWNSSHIMWCRWLRCRKREWRSIQRKYPRNPNTEKLSLVWWTNCTILFRPSIQYILVLGLFFDSHCILSVVDCMAPIAMAQVQSTTLVQYILVSSLTTQSTLPTSISEHVHHWKLASFP